MNQEEIACAFAHFWLFIIYYQLEYIAMIYFPLLALSFGEGLLPNLTFAAD